MSDKKIVTISKTYGRKVVIDYQTWQFGTTLVQQQDISDPATLIEEGEKLFDAAKKLTLDDIERTKAEMGIEDE